MLRLSRFLKPYLAWILLTILLLFVQANADLALPDYLSRIVNIGLQGSGIENAVPLALRQSTMEHLLIFATPGEQALITASYTLVDQNSPDYATYVEEYPALAKEPIQVSKLNFSDQPSNLAPVFHAS